MKAFRSIMAVIVGWIFSFVVIMIFDTASFALFKPADMPGFEDMEKMKAWFKALEKDPQKMADWFKQLPTESFLLVLVGWQIGAFIGGTISALIAGRRRLLHAGIIGGLVLASSIYNFLSTKNQYGFSHPDWMIVAGLLLPLPVSLLAGKFVAWMLPTPLPPPASNP